LLRLRTFAALRHQEFRLLWAGQTSTSMAMWMDQVVRGWLMYELTNSPVQLGLVHGMQALPILLLSPIAGSVADRYPRKQQVVLAQVLAGLMYALLALLILRGHIRPWHVYATTFVRGAFGHSDVSRSRCWYRTKGCVPPFTHELA
jgi:MFS family permease